MLLPYKTTQSLRLPKLKTFYFKTKTKTKTKTKQNKTKQNKTKQNKTKQNKKKKKTQNEMSSSLEWAPLLGKDDVRESSDGEWGLHSNEGACCGQSTEIGFVPMDFLTDRYRSRLLLITSFFLFYISVVMWLTIGTGLPCEYTHVIREDLFDSDVDGSCRNQGVSFYAVKDNGTEIVTLITILQTLKFLFSCLGNSLYHSVVWLIPSFIFDIYILSAQSQSVGKFCHRQCYFSDGTLFTPNGTQQTCALHACMANVEGSAMTNDMCISWSIIFTTSADLVFHFYVILISVLLYAKVIRSRNTFSPYITSLFHSYLDGEFTSFRFPARFLVSFFSNIFLGTVVSIAGFFFLLGVANSIDNLIPSDIESAGNEYDQLIDFTRELASSLRIAVYVAVPLSFSLFLLTSSFNVVSFYRDATAKEDISSPNKLEISLAPQFVGAFISNCLFGLSFSWVILGSLVFLFANSYVLSFLASQWVYWLSLCISPAVTYASRVIFLENLFAKPEKGISHSKSYRFVDFVLCILSSVAGPFYGFFRILYALGILLLVIQRIDRAIIPTPYEDWDFVYLYYRHLLNIFHLRSHSSSLHFHHSQHNLN
jgi:hypothetical protein